MIVYLHDSEVSSGFIASVSPQLISINPFVFVSPSKVRRRSSLINTPYLSAWLSSLPSSGWKPPSLLILFALISIYIQFHGRMSLPPPLPIPHSTTPTRAGEKENVKRKAQESSGIVGASFHFPLKSLLVVAVVAVGVRRDTMEEMMERPSLDVPFSSSHLLCLRLHLGCSSVRGEDSPTMYSVDKEAEGPRTFTFSTRNRVGSGL